MSAFPEAGRLVAHVMLDSVTSHSSEADLETNTATANLALARINEIPDAVGLTIEGIEDAKVDLDLSNVLGAALITLHRAVELLAQERGVDAEIIVAELRDYVDR